MKEGRWKERREGRGKERREGGERQRVRRGREGGIEVDGGGEG